MKKIILEFTDTYKTVTGTELKQERTSITTSGNFPMSAPCRMEIDCGDGQKLYCETSNPGETCTYLAAGALGHEEPIGIKCGSTIKQCSTGGESGSGV